MKILTIATSAGEKGKTLTKMRLSLGLIDGYNASNIEGFVERLSQTLPALSIYAQQLGTKFEAGSGIAELMARSALALQESANLKHTYWQVCNTEIPATYDITFSCENETIGEYVARAAFRIVRSALYRQRYSVWPDINMLILLTQQVRKAPIISMPVNAKLAV